MFYDGSGCTNPHLGGVGFTVFKEGKEICGEFCQVVGFGGRRLLRKEKKGANFIPWQELGM